MSSCLVLCTDSWPTITSGFVAPLASAHSFQNLSLKSASDQKELLSLGKEPKEGKLGVSMHFAVASNLC